MTHHRCGCLLVAALLLTPGCAPTRQARQPSELVATYSIVACDPATGDLGVAVQSKFFGVGSVVPWASAGVGAIATQSYANTTYGPDGLMLLKSGMSAGAVIETLTGADSRRNVRQLGVIGADGNAAAFTGEKCQGWAGHLTGKHFSVQGNLLAGGQVITNMAKAFEEARTKGDGELADWLMAALDAGEVAGGDRRGRQSAALLVVRKDGGYAGLNDRYMDLRVEDNPEPLHELRRLIEGHRAFYKRR